MRRLARIVLALQVAGAAYLAMTQVSASAQPSASPSASPPASSSAPAEPSPGEPSPAASSPAASSPGPGGTSSPAPEPSSASATPTSPAPSESPTAAPHDGRLSIATGSTSVVAQVGDLVHYRTVVANDGDGALERVFVVGFLPPEVRFVSADLLPEVEATLYNRIGDDESVTWNIGEIAPGEEITLPWTGRVASAGDMTAVSAVRAVADGSPRLRRESSTYLATAANLGGPNPSPRPTTTRVVGYERVPTDSVLGSSDTSTGDGSAVVPETGFDGSLVLSVSVLLVALGALFWSIASPRAGRRRRIALALAAMALLAACTSGNDVDRAAPEPTGSPEVKGRRIGPEGQVRDLGGDRNEPGGDEVPGPEDGGDAPSNEPPDGPPPAEPDPVEDFTLVRTVDVISIDPFMRPVERLSSHDGDGGVAYSWDGAGIHGLGPARDMTGDHPLVRVDTTLRDRGATLEAVVTITNTSADTPVLVDGRLGLTIQGSAHGSLTAGPTAVTLMPGGSTAASFAFDLPRGLYASEGFFEAS